MERHLHRGGHEASDGGRTHSFGILMSRRAESSARARCVYVLERTYTQPPPLWSLVARSLSFAFAANILWHQAHCVVWITTKRRGARSAAFHTDNGEEGTFTSAIHHASSSPVGCVSVLRTDGFYRRQISLLYPDIIFFRREKGLQKNKNCSFSKYIGRIIFDNAKDFEDVFCACFTHTALFPNQVSTSGIVAHVSDWWCEINQDIILPHSVSFALVDVLFGCPACCCSRCTIWGKHACWMWRSYLR